MDHYGQNEPSTIQMFHWRMLTFRMLSSRSNWRKLLPQESEEAFAESTAGGPRADRYTWGYNPYKRPYKWIAGVTTLLIGVLTLLITGRGPPCTKDFFSKSLSLDSLEIATFFCRNHNIFPANKKTVKGSE